MRISVPQRSTQSATYHNESEPDPHLRLVGADESSPDEAAATNQKAACSNPEDESDTECHLLRRRLRDAGAVGWCR